MSKTGVLRCFLCAPHLVELSQALNSFVSPDGSVVLEEEPQTVNLDFGGAVPGGTTEHKVARGRAGRRVFDDSSVHHPELVKSLVCGTTSCEDCQDKSGCWHGIEDKPRRFENNGRPIGNKDKKRRGVLEIKVAPSAATASTKYEAEVWARCSSDGGEWVISRILNFENGFLSVYVDNKIKTFGNGATEVAPGGDKRLGGISFRIVGDQKARVKLVFRVKDPSKPASVSVKLRAKDVDPMVEDCMSVKNCLDVLGNGGDAGFLLRNNNKYQLTCLQGGALLSDEVEAECVKWKLCMTDLRKTKLLAFLKAGQDKDTGRGGKGRKVGKVGKGSILLNDQARAVSSEDPVLCVDPEHDDPESWECDCLPEMIKSCGNKNNAKCFRKLMCDDAEICGHWKDEHCDHDSSLDEQSILQNQSRSMMAQRSAVSSSVGMDLNNSLSGSSIAQKASGALDGSVAGKCNV